MIPYPSGASFELRANIDLLNVVLGNFKMTNEEIGSFIKLAEDRKTVEAVVFSIQNQLNADK